MSKTLVLAILLGGVLLACAHPGIERRRSRGWVSSRAHSLRARSYGARAGVWRVLDGAAATARERVDITRKSSTAISPV